MAYLYRFSRAGLERFPADQVEFGTERRSQTKYRIDHLRDSANEDVATFVAGEIGPPDLRISQSKVSSDVAKIFGVWLSNVATKRAILVPFSHGAPLPETKGDRNSLAKVDTVRDTQK